MKKGLLILLILNILMLVFFYFSNRKNNSTDIKEIINNEYRKSMGLPILNLNISDLQTEKKNSNLIDYSSKIKNHQNGLVHFFYRSSGIEEDTYILKNQDSIKIRFDHNSKQIFSDNYLNETQTDIAKLYSLLVSENIINPENSNQFYGIPVESLKSKN
ncbi:MAG: hypothetical protein ACK5IC_10695 [Moheibacter sp.]